MKIAVSGKGGVGKTTVSAMLAAELCLQGQEVIALDADPDANLASALGVPDDEQPTALSEMEDLIAERTGARDNYGGYFKLNPRVDDLPEQFARQVGNIRLLVLGGVRRGGGGCICPATALVKALLTHLVLGRDENIIMDMEAGIEHLGRATAQSMDALLIVVGDEPWSIQAALRIRKLAKDIRLNNLFAVANAVKDPAGMDRTRRALDGIPLVGQLPYDERVRSPVVRPAGETRLEASPGLLAHRAALQDILSKVQKAV